MWFHKKVQLQVVIKNLALMSIVTQSGYVWMWPILRASGKYNKHWAKCNKTLWQLFKTKKRFKEKNLINFTSKSKKSKINHLLDLITVFLWYPSSVLWTSSPFVHSYGSWPLNLWSSLHPETDSAFWPLVYHQLYIHLSIILLLFQSSHLLWSSPLIPLDLHSSSLDTACPLSLIPYLSCSFIIPN